MGNPRPEKVAVVEEVRARLDGAGAVLVTEYRGLNVAAMATLRRALADAGGDFKIYKNTLVRFAAQDLGLELDTMLTGPTAIAFVEGDAVNVAKALRDFARTNPALVVKGGLLGGNVLDAGRVRALADIEPREVLLARLAGAFAAPMQQFAGLLGALPRNLAYGIKALLEQGGAPGAPQDEPAPVAAEETAPPDGDGPAESSDESADGPVAADAEPADPDVNAGTPTPETVEEAETAADAVPPQPEPAESSADPEPAEQPAVDTTPADPAGTQEES